MPRAKEIISREKTSRDMAQNYADNIQLHEDFALAVLKKHSIPDQKEGGYILININTATCTSDKLEKIQRFCKQYPKHKRVYFPCDMTDDIDCFETVKSFVPGLDLYDRTKHSLEETIQLFSQSAA
ncbi:hypothetical protein KKG31_02160 [Patescibacteria group bacterium]|nr:hypothetical protein [Patescibacteria group bacterium]MBU1757977.1 hypothetical protein [Patescibacteria group bacterium]